MAVFYSFYYKRDVNRVQLIENMGAVEGQTILNHQAWEEVKGRGRAAIEKWIDDEMKRKTAVIVLIGQETSTRPWVKYEIEKAWNEKKPLLGIYIHGLSSMGTVDSQGANPLSAHGIEPFNPTQTDWYGRIDSKATYGYLKDHLKSWATQGKTRLW